MPAAPTISAVHPGDEALTVVWTAPEGVTGVTAYDLRWILTSADETVDSNWTVEEDVWTEGELLYVLFGLINGSGYDVQVRAVTDADGRGPRGATPAEPINVFVAAVALPLGLLAVLTSSRSTCSLRPSHCLLVYRLARYSPDDYDLFRFTLTEETGVILFARGPVDTVGVLYDEDAVSLDDNDDGGLGGEPWNFAIGTSLDAGTYYVQVSGAPSSGIGTYTVHAGTIRDTTGRGTAQEVALGSTEVGLFESKADRDYFRFTLEESANVSVRSGGPFTDAGRGHDYRGAGLLGALSSHGTSTAGIVAARDNDLGGRGVAPRATVYGYNFLRTGADQHSIDAATRNMATTAVSSNSWGFSPSPGLNAVVPGWERAVRRGVTTGYGGKGVSYVWSAGNGHLVGDHTNLGGHTNLYAVTTVCAVNDRGQRSEYSEQGASLWLCAPSRDGFVSRPSILAPYNYGRYGDFGGTSAAAPTVGTEVEFVEFVEINTDFDARAFRDLQMELVSPSNAVSVLSVPYPVSDPDAPRFGLRESFRFGSARHLGENPAGTWTLRMSDHVRGGAAGTLRSWSLKIYGHRSTPGAPEISFIGPGPVRGDGRHRAQAGRRERPGERGPRGDERFGSVHLLQPGELGDSDQGAGRLRTERPCVGVRRVDDGPGLRDPCDRHGDRDGEGVPERAGAAGARDHGREGVPRLRPLTGASMVHGWRAEAR